MSNPLPPVYNQQVVAQGLARLTSAFITKPNIRKVLAVYLQPFQDLEDAIFAVYTGRVLANAPVYALPQTNVVFDVIGRIVGEARGAVSDADMKALIYLRIAVNRSHGLVTDWSRFAQILNPFCDTPPIYYDDLAGLYLGCWNIQLPALTVAFCLARAVPNGVAGKLAYSTWPDGNDFEWSTRGAVGAGFFSSLLNPTAWFDVTELPPGWFDPDLIPPPTLGGAGEPGQGGWGDHTDPTVGGFLVSGVVLQGGSLP